MASPKPIKPHALLAITAAVAGPPIRGCRISIRLVNTTGNSARIPVIEGPTQPDSATTVATSAATMEARSGMSYQRRVISGILTWRKCCKAGTQIAKVAAFAIKPPASERFSARMSAASANQVATATEQLTRTF